MRQIIHTLKGARPLPLGMIAGLLLALLWIAMDTRAEANGEINTTATNIAIEGYDSVAYFTMQKAVPGSPQFSHHWKNAIWLFASAEHRDMFANNPKKFAPQYGGY